MKVSFIVLSLFGITFGLDPSPLDVDQPTILTKLGKVQGTRKSIAKSSYEEFLGIRYGQIPKRFKYSEVNTDSWTDVFKATSYGPNCTQVPIEGTSEDCLFINIWRPEMDYSSIPSLLPVLLWVHGSSYQTGSGSQSPGDIIAASGPVIVATINYRLGAFGFAFGHYEEIQGNQGISDVITALKWVRENIESFGGDPSQVILSGHSAGSMMGSIFPVLPTIDQSLYLRLFTLSGVSVTPMFIENTTVATAKTKLLAEKVGCGPVAEGQLTRQVIECLQTVNASIIIEKNQDDDIKVLGGAELVAFMPVYGTQLIPKPLVDLFWSNHTSQRKEIFNVAAKDETATFWSYLKPTTREEAYAMAWEKLSFIKKDLTIGEMNSFYYHYFNGINDGETRKLRTALTNFINDATFRCTSLTLYELYSTRHFVHFAEFDYIIDKYGPEQRPDGPWHGDSVEIFFGDPLRSADPTQDQIDGGSYSARDVVTSKRLIKQMIRLISKYNDWPLLHYNRLKPNVSPMIRSIDFRDRDVEYDKQAICTQWSKLLGFDITKN